MSGYSETFSRTWLVTFNAHTSQIAIKTPVAGAPRTYSDMAPDAVDCRNAIGAPVHCGSRAETYIGQLPGTGIVTLHDGAYYLSTNDTGLTPGKVLTVSRWDFSMGLRPGSLIATPEGEVAVETLVIGDRVTTADGRQVPVRWIGRQTVHTGLDISDRLLPIRFAAGSLGEGIPHRDLMVTADHGMLIDGVICQAGALVNGDSITRVPRAKTGRSYIAYHIETEAHEIILANGAPAETFIDNVSRRVFDNFAEFEALYGDVPEMEELPYPRAMSARQVPSMIQARLAARLTA